MIKNIKEQKNDANLKKINDGYTHNSRPLKSLVIIQTMHPIIMVITIK
jgi:hypothetical protein